MTGCGSDFFQRPLDPVIDVIEDTGPERCENSFARPDDFLTGLQTSGLLVDLHGGDVVFQGNDFAHKAFLPHIDHLGHHEIRGILHIDDGSVDAVDDAGFFFCLGVHEQASLVTCRSGKPPFPRTEA